MRRFAVYGFIALLAFLITYIFLSSESGKAFLAQVQGDEREVAYLLRSDPCAADESSYDCWEEYYARIIGKHGSHVALLDLKGRYEQGGYPRLYCHTLLHPIGEAAGHEYSSVAAAYAKGDTFCRSGYYHGVLEGVFGHEGSEQLLHNLDSLCAEVKGKERYSYDYFSCVHGIGHGLMAYSDHELFESLEGCDKLSGEWEKSSCHGGVFMENVISDMPDEPSKYLKRDDPLYPCNAVADTYRYQCYLMQTSHMLTIYDGDFAKVFAACSGVEAKYRAPCYQSLGRDASGWSYGSIDEVAAYCTQGRTAEQRAECLAGAGVDFIQSQGAEAARELCKWEEGGNICSQAVEQSLGAL
ncbi:MAG: hypothetical protein A2854_02985 [Parcubacteria group bacterium RIFCSPHIGHO2_01_FULL_56_18]|nr:MAG: hypothetical protein A2854_02985 [Parcubacteria group bacterium RIFCSPHIGHO2_01_FULL_56_18]